MRKRQRALGWMYFGQIFRPLLESIFATTTFFFFSLTLHTHTHTWIWEAYYYICSTSLSSHNISGMHNTRTRLTKKKFFFFAFFLLLLSSLFNSPGTSSSILSCCCAFFVLSKAHKKPRPFPSVQPAACCSFLQEGRFFLSFLNISKTTKDVK